MINVYPMHSKNQFPDVYDNFIREEGCPSILRRDNAGAEMSHKVTAINCKYLVGDQYTEPHHPQQNPAVLRAVKFVKDHTEMLLNCRNAPEKVWFYASDYVAKVHNICADESLGWEIPLTKRHGTTPDISPYLIFQFYKKVLFSTMTSLFHPRKNVLDIDLGFVRMLATCSHSGSLQTTQKWYWREALYVRLITRLP
jgi:hypothetical protein